MSDGDSPFDEGRYYYARLGQPPAQSGQDEGGGQDEPAGQEAPAGAGQEPGQEPRQPAGQGWPAAGPSDARDARRVRRSRRVDRVIGGLLGIMLGVAIIVGFVFLGSENTIDAPQLDRSTPAGQSAPGAAPPGAGQTAPATGAGQREREGR